MVAQDPPVCNDIKNLQLLSAIKTKYLNSGVITNRTLIGNLLLIVSNWEQGLH